MIFLYIYPFFALVIKRIDKKIKEKIEFVGLVNAGRGKELLDQITTL